MQGGATGVDKSLKSQTKRWNFCVPSRHLKLFELKELEAQTMFNGFKTTTLAAITAAATLLGSGQAWAISGDRSAAQEFFYFGGQLGDGSVARLPSRASIDNCSFRIGRLDFVGDTTQGDPRVAWDVSLGDDDAGVALKPNREAWTFSSAGNPQATWRGSGASGIRLFRINECLAARGLTGTAQNLQQFSGSASIETVEFYGFSFEYLGDTYRFGWEGLSNSVPLNPLIVDPDTTAPTVMFDEYPNALSGDTPFTVKTIFSEDVTGFNEIPADVDVVNGDITAISAGTLLPDGREEYTLTITPTGAGDVTITVPDGAAQDDPAGNDNIASDPLTISNTIVEITQEAIAGFMLGRANNLASNQPGLTRFLQGDGCGTFSANATEGSGSINGCASNGNTWAEISGSWSGNDSYTLTSFGAHGFVNPNLLVGGMVQFDYAEDSTNNASGNGYMVGPYFVAQVPDQPLFLEGRLLYGQTDNDISPLDTYTDSFETERWLAQLRATGEYQVQATTLMPLLDFTYTDDSQKAYTDSLGNTIPGQTVSLKQLTAGMDFSTPISVSTGALELTGGLSGIYSSTDGGAAAPEFENWRGRTHLGLNYGMASGATLSATTFYDGIGTDYEGYGASLGFDLKF
jgi:hypothetical protein